MSKALIQVFCGNMAHQLTRNSYKHLKQKFAKCLSFRVFLTMRSYALKRAQSSPHTNSGIVTTALRVPNMFFGIRVLHCLKGGIRDFKEKWGRVRD